MSSKEVIIIEEQNGFIIENNTTEVIEIGISGPQGPQGEQGEKGDTGMTSVIGGEGISVTEPVSGTYVVSVSGDYATNTLVESVSGALQSQIDDNSSAIEDIETNAISGSGVAGQIAIWDDTKELRGDVDLTYSDTEGIIIKSSTNPTVADANEVRIGGGQIIARNEIKVVQAGSPGDVAYAIGQLFDNTGFYRTSPEQSDESWGWSSDSIKVLEFKPGGLDVFGDVTISDNLYVNGTEFIVNTETVSASDNIIEINGGEVGPGVTSGYSGIKVDRGTEEPYFFVFDENRDAFVVGVASDETSGALSQTQVVATRENDPIDGGIAIFDDASKKFLTISEEDLLSAYATISLVESVSGSLQTQIDDNTTLITSVSGSLQTQIDVNSSDISDLQTQVDNLSGSDIAYTPEVITDWSNATYPNPENVQEGLDGVASVAKLSIQRATNKSSTSVLFGGEIVVNSSTSINISAGAGGIYDYDNIVNGLADNTLVLWQDQINVEVPNLTGGEYTWVAIDDTGTPVFSPTDFSRENYRNYAVLGRVIHINGIVTNTVDLQQKGIDVHGQLSDLASAIGSINIAGNTIQPHDENNTLEISRTAGETFRFNVNSTTNLKNLHTTTDIECDPCTLIRVYRDGAGQHIYEYPETELNPDNYDDGTGTLGTVLPNKYTIQRTYYLTGEPTTLIVLYGQAVYNSLSEAIANIGLEVVEDIPGFLEDATLRSYIVVKSGITNFSNTNDYYFQSGGKFQGDIGGGGSGGSQTEFSDLNFAVYYDSQPDKTFTFDLSNLDVTGEGIVMAANAAQDGDITLTLPSESGQLALNSYVESVSGNLQTQIDGNTTLITSVSGSLQSQIDDNTTLITSVSGSLQSQIDDNTTLITSVSGSLQSQIDDNTNDIGEITTVVDDLTAAHEVTMEPTGFANTNEDSTIYVIDGSRTFGISPDSGSYEYWIQSEKYEVSGTNEYIFDDTEGLHYAYFDGSTLLVRHFTVAPDFPELLRDYAYIAAIYWDATNNKSYTVDERHGMMPWQTHYNLHIGEGSRYVSGLALGNFTSDASGDLDAHAQFTNEAGSILDEDITNDTLAKLTTDTFNTLYKSGASGDWRWETSSAPIINTGGTGRAMWNEFTGGAWQLTEIANNDFVNAHIFATNGIEQKIIAVVGQADYTTIAQARDGVGDEIANLVLEGFPFQEFIYIGAIIYQTSDGYTNTWQSRVRTNDLGDDYLDFRFSKISSSGSVASHSALSGLTNDDHLQYALLDGRSGDKLLIDEIGEFTASAGITSDSDFIVDADAHVTNGLIVGTYVEQPYTVNPNEIKIVSESGTIEPIITFDYNDGETDNTSTIKMTDTGQLYFDDTVWIRDDIFHLADNKTFKMENGSKFIVDFSQFNENEILFVGQGNEVSGSPLYTIDTLATSGDLDNYVLKSGDTMSGDLTVSDGTNFNTIGTDGTINISRTGDPVGIWGYRTDGKAFGLVAGSATGAFRFDDSGNFRIQSQPRADLEDNSGSNLNTLIDIDTTSFDFDSDLQVTINNTTNPVLSTDPAALSIAGGAVIDGTLFTGSIFSTVANFSAASVNTLDVDDINSLLSSEVTFNDDVRINNNLTVTNDISAGGNIYADNISNQTIKHYQAHEFLNPTNSDWGTANFDEIVAPLQPDISAAGLQVRLFDDTDSEGIGFILDVGDDTTEIDIVSKIGTRGTTGNVVYDIEYREISDTGPGTWTSLGLLATALTTDWFKDSTRTTSTFTAGKKYQILWYRYPDSLSDTVTGDVALQSVKIVQKKDA